MPELPIHPELQQQFNELIAGIADRVVTERWYADKYDGQAEARELRFRETVESIRARFTAARAATQQERETDRENALRQYQTAFNVANTKSHTTRREVEQEFGIESLVIDNERDESRWMVTSVLDADADDSPQRQLELFQGRLQETREELQHQTEEIEAAYSNAVQILRRRRQWQDSAAPEPVPPPGNRKEARDRFAETYAACQRVISELVRLPLSRMLAGWNFPIILLLCWLGISAALFFVDQTALQLNFPQDKAGWALFAGGIAFVPTVLIGLLLHGINRTKMASRLRAVHNAIHAMRTLHRHWREFAKSELKTKKDDYRHWQQAFERDRDTNLRKIDAIHARKSEQAYHKQHCALEVVESRFTAVLEDLERTRDRQIETVDARLEQQLGILQDTEAKEIEEANRVHTHLTEKVRNTEQHDRTSIANKWTATVSRMEDAVFRQQEDCRRSSPDWNLLAHDGWKLPAEIPQTIRFGEFDCDFARLPDGLPQHDWLQGTAKQFALPATLSFPSRASLLFKASDGGRRVAVDSLRTIMLRLLTSLPAGKVRFTVIDPVGLGEPFSVFMHLADVDELMIGSRIWTEPAHIEKRLAELSEHMENVFQAYLRNEFATIDEYNRHAGEVAEPYHILVVANFPTNFSEEAARRLTNIATSGPRCGVYTLLSVDTALALPHNFDLADLEDNAATLEWKGNRFVSADPQLEILPLRLETAPESKEFSRIVRAAARLSVNARRVEVPFERIAPRDDEIWTFDSRSGIDVPLGRAGAMKLQSLSLGRGTSQHVLVAGKTGAGKSTFLHTLITNLSLQYAPDQIEFYLIDFKKGVEFKTYATHGLPHARVIGIESDREFGVSVLERLNDILKERGELFRTHGVQDIESFRDGRPEACLPRILLVVDEFQEFFTEDDALAQTATLLLDRLVRQGRAFGVHVLLGSQTLGGAYTLARSTLGQIAVRIALQCSDSDAHLILSEENTAARLLTRPGEAIYNDANGLLEGNHPFQIAWLPEDQREKHLCRIQEMARQRGVKTEPPIVFEGNIASDVRKNRSVVQMIESFPPAEEFDSTSSATRHAPAIWLGEAVSLKAPTRTLFHRRAGNNLLIVGQDSDAAHGLLTVSFLTLAAQLQPGAPIDGSVPVLTVLDGEQRNSEAESRWQPLIAAVPHAACLAGQHNAANAVSQIATEVRRRCDDGRNDFPPMFLIISDLSRFRELRNDRDDFGFNFSGSDGEQKPAGAGAMLADILRDGPALGVHTIVWCDSFGSLSRWVTNPTQREFDRRIAFRMNGSDSSNLIDTPAASRLGVHRALLYHGESGVIEKFRPYSAPLAEWITWCRDRFFNRPVTPGEWDDIGSLNVS